MNKGKFQSLQARLSKWLIDLGDSLLAQSAREVLIKAIAQAIPTYVMGVFKLPASVCDDLEQLIRNYWWGSEKGKRKIHWIGWPRLLRPKSQGGMGFKDMRLFNQSLLARQAWRLINFPNSLCARVLRARYHPNGDLIDTVFTGNPSSTWTAIVYGLELLKKGVVWRVGNGRSIRIWRDSWLPRRSYMKVLSPRRSSRLRWVSELLDTSGQWRTELVRRTFNPIDAEVILSIKPAFRFDDVLAWQPEKTGIFSVRSAYRLAFTQMPIQCNFAASSSRPEGDDVCWQKIWKANVPPKVKTFAWKAASNALATELNKKSRGIKVTGTCLICGSAMEDTQHALFSCPHANHLWSAMSDVWHIPRLDELRVQDGTWLHSVITSAQPSMVDAILLIAWRTWHAHNEATHSKPLPSTEGSKRFLISYLRSYRQARELTTEEMLHGKQILGSLNLKLEATGRRKEEACWSKPAAGWVKLNCDGSYRIEDGSAGAGMLLRDEHGQVIFSACRQLQSCNEALEAEVHACRERVALALQWSTKPLVVELDCVGLVEINKSSLDRSAFSFLIQEIKALVNSNRTISVVKVDRIQNRASDCLANFARQHSRTVTWVSSGPECLRKFLEADLIVSPIE
jgi:ribonuclease HI